MCIKIKKKLNYIATHIQTLFIKLKENTIFSNKIFLENKSYQNAKC